SDRDDDRYLPANEIGGERRQAIVLTFRPAVFDGHVPAFDVTGFAQALTECVNSSCERGRRCTMQKPDDRHRSLLRTRPERPRGRRTAEQRDERAAGHLITSSARWPSFLARLRKALTQIFCVHDRYNLHCGIQIQEQWFDNLHNLRRLGDIKKQHPGALAIQWREVRSLRFQLGHYRFHRSTERTVVERLVPFFDRKSKSEHHPHDRLQTILA